LTVRLSFNFHRQNVDRWVFAVGEEGQDDALDVKNLDIRGAGFQPAVGPLSGSSACPWSALSFWSMTDVLVGWPLARVGARSRLVV
jgi:hypothetical protein